MLNRLVASVRVTKPLQQALKFNPRRFGTSAGPWAAKHESLNYEPGYALGVGPKYRWEGYELPTVVLYFVMFYTLWDIDNREPDEMSLEEWAKNEALAREKAAAEGTKIEFGKYYWRPDVLVGKDGDWDIENALYADEDE